MADQETVPIVHWADGVARRIISEKGDKEEYTCAAGITPSGIIHIGNFREIITVDLVVKALRRAGKKVRFLYSWDDYDVFRKVPKGMPKQEMLHTQLRKPIVDIPDPFETDESYARHHERVVEEDIHTVGIDPQFLYQAKKYRAGNYVEGIRTALQQRTAIKAILDAYRKEPLEDDWYPLLGYCPDCNTDHVKFSAYDGEDNLMMDCTSCEKQFSVDIKNAPFLKLPWRVDWPMRWAHEKVDFEPGGKDHSTQGGSYTTAQEIVTLYGWEAPTYQMYDFVRTKGTGGKIASSKGDVITLRDCLNVYEPDMVRWLFAGTRANAEFAISFDADVIKLYEDFDRCERIYFDKEEHVDEKEAAKQKRIYELSCVSLVPEKMPFQPSFRHLTNVLQVFSLDIDLVLSYYKEHYSEEITDAQDEQRLRERALCAKNWLLEYAPDQFTYQIRTEADPELIATFSDKQKQALRDVRIALLEKDWVDKELHEYFYIILEKNDLDVKSFFTAFYQLLIGKTRGPQLANFILIIGKERVSELLRDV